MMYFLDSIAIAEWTEREKGEKAGGKESRARER